MPLHRSRDRRIVAGVCGGIAGWLGWSPLRVRLLYVVGTTLSVAVPGVLLYLLLWLIIPKAPR